MHMAEIFVMDSLRAFQPAVFFPELWKILKKNKSLRDISNAEALRWPKADGWFFDFDHGARAATVMECVC